MSPCLWPPPRRFSCAPADDDDDESAGTFLDDDDGSGVVPDDDGNDGEDDDDDSATDDDADDDVISPSYAAVSAQGQISAIVAAVEGEMMFATDTRHDEVIILDTEDFEVQDRIPVGLMPVDIDMNPGGYRFWVATRGETAVTWVDNGSKGQGTVDLQHHPVAIAIGGNGKVYVVNDAGGIEILDEYAQEYLTEVTWDDGIPSPSMIAVDRGGLRALVANAGISPASVMRIDLYNDDLNIEEVNETGSLGSNGQSLTLAPDGDSFVFPCGSGNGPGDAVYQINTLNFKQSFGEYDIGTYPRYLTFDPFGAFAVGINGDPHDQRVYVLNPESLEKGSVIDVTDWLAENDEEPKIVEMNADGTVLVLYAENSTGGTGTFYLVERKWLQ
ncbi:MAG: hypothetical protein M5R36_18280 [Deltaproteobacteria bacterium]|nr:hypothetical protein [Deltaproteobacteria bacterium]